MASLWVWTHQYSTLDNGLVLSGPDLQNIQQDIVNQAVDILSVQTISGNKVFSGNVSFTGTVSNVGLIVDFVFYEDAQVAWEDEAVVYI
jgi:hypothetical protein